MLPKICLPYVAPPICITASLLFTPSTSPPHALPEPQYDTHEIELPLPVCERLKVFPPCAKEKSISLPNPI